MKLFKYIVKLIFNCIMYNYTIRSLKKLLNKYTVSIYNFNLAMVSLFMLYLGKVKGVLICKDSH